MQCLMKYNLDQWKYKTEGEIFYMHINEGLFTQWAKNTSERLAYKGLDPAAEDEII